MAFIVRVEGGKYAIVQNDHGQLRVDRGEIRGWLENPPGGKMLIALAGEIEESRKLLWKILHEQVGASLFAEIRKHMRHFQIEEEDCTEKPAFPTKERLERLVLDVLEASNAFCMDNAKERAALADALTVEVMGRFRLKERPEDEVHNVLSEVR